MKTHILLEKMIISCLQTVPKKTIEEALDEALDLASIAIKDNSKFLFLPEYCGGITSNGKLYFPPSEKETKHLFLNEFKKFGKKIRFGFQLLNSNKTRK